jgi:hypothetical protein
MKPYKYYHTEARVAQNGCSLRDAPVFEVVWFHITGFPSSTSRCYQFHVHCSWRLSDLVIWDVLE